MNLPTFAQVAPTRTELVPWTDKKGRLHSLRAAVFALLLLPGLWLVVRWAAGWLGPERLNAAIHSTGYWTIWLLLASLAVTPLKALSGIPGVVVVRRMLGNAALLYAALHLALYSQDQHWRLVTIALEILRRFYLTIGFAAVLGLLVLGLTSTDGWSRWLGRTWKQIHRAVYVIVVLGLVHYMLQSKLDVSQALLATGLFLWLMLWRVLPAGPDRKPGPLLGITVAAAVLTLVCEYLWYRFGTRVNPMKVIGAEFDIEYGMHPAGQVLLLGVTVTVLTELRRLGMTALGGTLLFTVAIYVTGAFGDGLAALMLGWTYDDILPEAMSPLLIDLAWAALLALTGLARWRLRDHPVRRLVDALWLGCVIYKCALLGSGSRGLGAGLAAAIVAAAVVLGWQIWAVSRGTALLLLPLALFVAYRASTLL